jgi:hypothetical protein
MSAETSKGTAGAWIAFCGVIIAAVIAGVFSLHHQAAIAPYTGEVNAGARITPQSQRRQHTFPRTLTSVYMEGGHTREQWCQQAESAMKGEYPPGTIFTRINTDERSRSRCSPFNCPEYQYDCSFNVTTAP